MNRERKSWLLTQGLVAVLGVCGAVLLGLAEPVLSLQTAPGALVSLAASRWLLAGYTLASGLVIAGYRWPKWRLTGWYSTAAATGLATALMLLIPYEDAQVLEAGHVALTNLYEVSIFILAVTGTLSLGFDLTMMPGRLLPFMTPLLAVGGGFVVWLGKIGAGTPKELIPALQNTILPFHVAANFIGYGCFAVGAGAGAALLLRLRADARGQASRLPPVPVLEKLGYRAVALGFPVFTIAILLGCLWAWQAWGGYWSWDPKETWALIVWLSYAAYLHVRLTRRPSPKVLAWWLLVGFLLTLFCYLGVNMFLSGLHSYGTLAA